MGGWLVAIGLALLAWYAGTYLERRAAQLEAFRRLDELANEAPAESARRGLEPGALVARISVPSADVDAVAFEGVDAAILKLGIGHFPGTPLPGQKGNTSFAAHRDSFFRGLRHVDIGDEVRVERGGSLLRYRITELDVVEPRRIEVIASRGRDEITLITCYPFDYVGPAPRRFVVHATLEGVSTLD